MNLFIATSWLWKGLRGRSITFAALFAFSLLGLSIVRAVRHVLGELGVPWLALIIFPIIFFGYLEKREREWMPDEEQRKRWARGLIFGAMGISVAIALVARKPEEPKVPPDPADRPVRMHGPSGK